MSSKVALLKETRLSKGLSIESVHEATKIPMDALRAIEEGYSIRTMSTFYYRGFVKIYAKYLGLDIEQFFDEVRVDKNPPPLKIPQPLEDTQRFDLKKFLTAQRREWIKKFLIAALGLFVLFKMGGCAISMVQQSFAKMKADREQKILQEKIKSAQTAEKNSRDRRDNPRESHRENTVATNPGIKDRSVAEPRNVERTVSNLEESGSSSGAVILKNVTLTVRAQKNTWLKVKLDGNVVFQSTLKTGTVETWMAQNKIELSGRNLNQLEFEVNGKMLGALGPEDRRAKELEVTQDGLSVIK